MKKYLKSSLALLLALVMVLSINVGVFAADSVVTFYGEKEGFGFQPGSEYTATDLFDEFKNVMPGDMLTEFIQIKNEAKDCDHIRLYMRAEIHDEIENPLSEKVAEEESVASMHDFLSQLTMRIYNDDQLIYDASPDEAGALADNVYLGTLYRGESLQLDVELDVPVDLSNEYSDRVGEVDWIFLAECIDYEHGDSGDDGGFDDDDYDPEILKAKKVWSDEKDKRGIRPKSISVTLYRGSKAVDTVTLNERNDWTYIWEDLDDDYDWTVRESEIPEGYVPSYRVKGNVVTITNTSELIGTGQLNWPIPVLGGLGILMFFLGIFMMRRKKENSNA